MAKRGRPKKKVKRGHLMAIRFSDDEHRKITKLADIAALPASTWGRVQLLAIVAAATLAAGCGGVTAVEEQPPVTMEQPDATPVFVPDDGGTVIVVNVDMSPVVTVDMTPFVTAPDMTPVACGAPRASCDPVTAPCCSGSCMRSNDNVLLLCCLAVNSPCGEPHEARCCPGTTCRQAAPGNPLTWCLP